MECVYDYFSTHPAAYTLLAIFIVIVILWFVLSKFIKLTILLLFIILLVGGVYLSKDPATMPDKIIKYMETLKSGGEQLVDKVSNFWRDAKDLADKVKKVPDDLNKMLDTSKKDADKL